MAKAGILATSVPDIKFWCDNQGVIFFLLYLVSYALGIFLIDILCSDPYKCQRKTCKGNTVEEELDAKVFLCEIWS